MKVKAFLDTNILLDILQEGRPHRNASLQVIQAVYEQKIEALITTQSIIDAAFIMEKAHVREHFFAALAKWRNYINIDQLNSFDILSACRNYNGDFEDAAQYYRAQDTRCNVIVTSDNSFRKRFAGMDEHLELMTPEEFVSRMTATK